MVLLIKKKGNSLWVYNVAFSQGEFNFGFHASDFGIMRFGQKWIKWCISMVNFFVLVNGTPFDFFQSSRGLRQEDSCSLFICVENGDNYLLERVKGRGGKGVEVSHLLFAN